MQIFAAAPSGGILVWRGKTYILTPVEFNILASIAEDGPIPVQGIGLIAFPASPPEAWQRMVSVYVGRLRKKVDEGLIDASKEGYRIGPENELQKKGM